jgi:hypothetical protein
MEQRPNKPDAGPGVPEALPRTLQSLGRTLGPSEIDRLWVFPPLVKGRREWGLVSISCFGEGGARHVMTARYSAERTGKGLDIETELSDEGIAPPDRLPRVMTGVSSRSPLGLGEARLVEIGGRVGAFEELLAEFDPGLLEDVQEETPQPAETVES